MGGRTGAAGRILPLLFILASCRNDPPPEEPPRMDTPPAVRARLFVEGRVQGVGFRWSTVEAARRIGDLTGWVRNLDDGRVEAVVEGPKQNVEALLIWARKGPPSSRVDKVDFTWEKATGEYSAFGID